MSKIIMMRDCTANFRDVLLEILLSLLGIFLKFGCHVEFWTCLLLTIWGYLPGIIYDEFWICLLQTIGSYLPGIIYATYVITFPFHFHFHPFFSAFPPFLSSSHRPESPHPLDTVSQANASAFHAIAPPSVASSSPSKKPCYDVFINHRGKDTKHKLASSIYNMLDLMGVQAFLDEEELEVGDSFPEAIEEAMRSASVHIAILSTSYAESPWCLEELAFMLRINVTVIPVFYHINPSDLRFVTKGKYADAFGQHEKKRQHGGERRYKLEKIKEWEEALSRVSYLNGFIVDGDKCDEGKLLREIVETAVHKMKKVPLEVATHPVGLDKAIQDFESKVASSTGSKDGHIVGIVGMGGSGKTTLAKELYNRKCSSLSKSSFLPNVRDAASTNTLHKLQEKLLEDLNIHHSTIHDIHEGMGMLARGLKSVTMLIVLDDVDHEDQIQALLPQETMHNLGPGSFIIVTSRERKALINWGISSIYDMKLLDRINANQLFRRHAFEHIAENSHNFQDLIERFVDACDGLPLSLKVLGAMVKGQSKDFWEAQLQKIQRILPKEITERLKLSYDALDPEVREMFLDVACFFIGGNKSMVVAIWDGSGSDGSRWSGEVGWVTLVNKCLVGLDKEGNIEMHDHLRDMGRQIARDVKPHRIWNAEQSIEGGRTLIRGILVGLSFPSYRRLHIYPPPSLEHFLEKMINRPSSPELQLLAVRGNDFGERFAALSKYLVWLRWHDFNGTNLPLWISLANLTVLELYDAKNLEELWQDNVQPPLQLKQMIIDGKDTCLQGLPRSIGRLRQLKKIVLKGCYDSGMRRLPEEFCDLESLEFLQLWNFPELSSLPHDFGKLIKLRTLKLDRVQLATLPASFKQLKALQTLEISGSKSFMLS